MKKIAFFVIPMFFALITNAQALSIFNSSFSDGTTTYDVVDRSSSMDTYNGSDGYTADDYTGSYIGTLIGGNNDNLDDSTWEAILTAYLGSQYTIDQLTKIDAPGTSNGDLAVTYSSDGLTGTWSTTGSNPATAVSFYSIKGAKEFALYYVDPSQPEGSWTTRHLLTPQGNNIPEISHFTADLSPAPVPEPATIILLGTGLLGLAGMGRRKFKK
jgi:hypothetical protein